MSFCASSLPLPNIINPMERAAASPEMALSEYKTTFNSSNVLDLFKIWISVLLFFCKKVISKSLVGTPERILMILFLTFSLESEDVEVSSKSKDVLFNSSWDAELTKSKATWYAINLPLVPL
ncbi:hypothetical protein WICPIJ_007707 [Wickerhamomyces pijperi]|uniref:Uncharacterized protein n=1 Tax=Wickerhamomyces pijperi TaxID=599730 RepID=A0A9P8Q1X6_WICPI|nr:hypothetical protein WICPIJ_007707 [Wickerhamomyces pijperi]